MTQKLFQIEAKIAATLYVKADSLEEALAKAAAVKGGALEVRDAGDHAFTASEVAISGARFDDPALPEISFSPAMTVDQVDATGYQTDGPEDEEA